MIIAKLGGYLNRGCDGPPGFQRQIVQEVQRHSNGECKVVSVPHYGGWVHNPDDILKAIKEAAK